ncbi:hypothetical protein H310_04898 [Aphanomyces invadans]|uniref:BZIP domain-containing protein n=1 Tax=Aphanomyces invadans TaxID=157072 RepID=A0A024UB10_9STRA|nr:hypothetical protein H310_04898 [Aphanomyces invadans]ETW03434.1 hypothetical protein H310_04898 [Aphanomyces invadans]|eukprot:XP_008867663.1 hypothetical protein H310_04898 [Aphanomyces invadans]
MTDEERLARSRQRCAINQRRYRAKLQAMNKQRRSDLEELSRVNKRLERHLAAFLDKRGLWCHAEEHSILEYLRLFERGFTHTEQQVSFLRYFVAPDAWYNGHIGIDGVMAYWITRSAMFTFLRVNCIRLTPVARTNEGTVIEMRCVVHLGMTLPAMRALFPHVLNRQDLVDNILRTPLQLPLHGTYVFDDNKQMTWQSCASNIVEALSHQFVNLDDVVAATCPNAATKAAIQSQ